MLRSTAGAILLLLLQACIPARTVISRASEPGATVTALRALSFDRQHAELVVEMEIDNPGAALAIASANYEVLAQGRAFATGTVAVTLPVPAGARTHLTLPIHLAYLDLPYLARDRVSKGKSVQLVARGTLRGTSGTEAATVEFDGEAEVGLTSESELP
jgi:hypothetical protein